MMPELLVRSCPSADMAMDTMRHMRDTVPPATSTAAAEQWTSGTTTTAVDATTTSPPPLEEAPVAASAPVAITTMAAAMRRRRAARAPVELRAEAVAKLQAYSTAASAAVPKVQICPLDAARVSAVLALNLARLPGKVCTQALATRLQANAAHCLVATEVHSGAGGAGGGGSGHGGMCETAPSPVEGFVLYESSRGCVDVVLLAVQSTSEGRGIGRALLSAALANAAAAGCYTASLSVRADNAPALQLYHSLGFAVRAPRTSVPKLVDGFEPSAGPGYGRLTMQWCLI